MSSWIFVWLSIGLYICWSVRIVLVLHCLALKYSWLIIYYMILSLFVSYSLLLGWALFRFCSVFVLCCSFSTIRWWSQSKWFICISFFFFQECLFASLGKWWLAIVINTRQYMVRQWIIALRFYVSYILWIVEDI